MAVATHMLRSSQSLRSTDFVVQRSSKAIGSVRKERCDFSIARLSGRHYF